MAESCDLFSLGVIDPNTVVKVVKEVTAEEKTRQQLMVARPSLDEIVNLHDFEVGTTWRQQHPVELLTSV